MKKSWMPTRKWWVTTVTAVGTIVVAALTGDGINTDAETILVVGIVVQRVVGYIIPNEDTPGGVPLVQA